VSTRRVGSTFRGVDGRWLRVPVEGEDVLILGPQDTSKENAVRSSGCRACAQRIRHSMDFHDKELMRMAMRSISIVKTEGVIRLTWHAHAVSEEDRPEDDHAPFLRPQETDSQIDNGDWGDESQLVPEAE
jgi:hypothetical protein